MPQEGTGQKANREWKQAGWFMAWGKQCPLHSLAPVLWSLYWLLLAWEHESAFPYGPQRGVSKIIGAYIKFSHFPQASSPTAWASACFRPKQVSIKEPPRVSVSVVSRSHIPEMLHCLWVKQEPKVLAHLNTQHVLYRNFYLNIRSVESFESFVCKL